jgi:hypothetical protein
MLLEERGYTFPSVMDKDTHTREMKEKFTYVAEDISVHFILEISITLHDTLVNIFVYSYCFFSSKIRLK